METRILLIFDRIASATTPACQSGLTYPKQAPLVCQKWGN